MISVVISVIGKGEISNFNALSSAVTNHGIKIYLLENSEFKEINNDIIQKYANVRKITDVDNRKCYILTNMDVLLSIRIF